jgi:uncharacterized coiled-coil protein SlyX
MPGGAAAGPEMSPYPCGLHDDRLRALEIEEAETRQTLGQVVRQLERIETGITRLDGRVERLDQRVSKLSDDVAEVRVAVAEQGVQIKDLQKFVAKEEKSIDRIKDGLWTWAPRVFVGGLLLAGGAKGHAMLEYLVKVLG